jgi:hypothetical protein
MSPKIKEGAIQLHHTDITSPSHVTPSSALLKQKCLFCQHLEILEVNLELPGNSDFAIAQAAFEHIGRESLSFVMI